MSWNIKDISPAWLLFRHPKDVSKETQLTLPNTVDEGLGACHLVGPLVAYTNKSLDAKHNPVA